jgi:hypothetical protein
VTSPAPDEPVDHQRYAGRGHRYRATDSPEAPAYLRATGADSPILRGVPGEASVTDRLPGDAVDGVKGSRVPGAGSMVSTTRVARSSNRAAGEAVRMRIVIRT